MPDFRLKDLALKGRIDASRLDNYNLRKPTVKFALSQALFHPTPRLPVRGKGAMYPSDEQLKPLIALSSSWLQVLPSTNDEVKRLQRTTLLVADEGGMGKTYSCSIALNWILETKGNAVVVICPPSLLENWNIMLKKFGHQPNWLKGNQLAEGRIEDGINLISTYTVQKYPIGPIIQDRIKERLSAVLIDEAHRGMIADNVLRDSISSVCSVAKQRILVTATPMRKGRDDLFALIHSGSKGTEDEDASAKARDIFMAREEFIFSSWLPMLARMRDNKSTPQDVELIRENWKCVLPLTETELSVVENQFNEFESKFQKFNDSERIQLAQDLHPLGRFLCCTLRDDLGEKTCLSRFRVMQSRTLGYSLSEDYVKEIDNILTFLDSSKPRRILAECLLNSSSEEEYSSLRDFEPSKEDLQRFEHIFQQDERWSHLKDVFETERGAQKNGKAKAVVIFCHYRGAIRHIARHLESDEFIEWGLRIHTPTLPDDNDDSVFHSNARQLAKKLRTIGMNAIGERLDVVLCGPGVGEGHDMQWATHVVHWSMPSKAAEELAQKNWRLDRRINGDWQESKFHVDFRITYLIEKNENNQIENLNEIYSRNRRFLLHRTFMENLNSDILIPPLQSGWYKRKWSETPSGFFPIPSHVVKNLIRYLKGD